MIVSNHTEVNHINNVLKILGKFTNVGITLLSLQKLQNVICFHINIGNVAVTL